MLPDYLQKFLHRIAKGEKFSNYKIETEAGSSHGDNFLGILTAVTISGTKERENGESATENLQLICKTQPSNEERNQFFATDLMFDREVYMYSKVLPSFVRFQQEKGLNESDSFLSFPKMYVSEFDEESKKYVLIMEDLRQKEFAMWPKQDLTPIDHGSLVMQELGKFYAISFAMKDQRPNEFKEFSKMPEIFSHAVIPAWKPYFIETLEKLRDVLVNPVHRKIMQKLRDNFEAIFDDLLCGPKSQEFGVIGHGDMRKTNYLFQHADQNEPDKPTAVSFVDWQLGYYGPVSEDLLLNIFNSTDSQIRKNHYKHLFKTYYSSLSETVKKLGSDPNKLFTYDDLQSQFKIFGQISLMRSAPLTLNTLASAKDVEDMEKYVELIRRGENAHLMKEFDAETKQKFIKVTNELVTDFVNYGCVQSE